MSRTKCSTSGRTASSAAGTSTSSCRGPLIAQVAYLLLDLAERDPAGRPVARLSHTTMAHLLGARRQSVTRVVGELRDRGWVETTYGSTLIVDTDGLREVMGREPLP